jgi:endothelin-converting enzyme
MSLQDASALTPKIDLANIISGLSADHDVSRVIVAAPKYMKDLQTILAETGEAVLQSYFVWKAVQAFYRYVDSPVLKPYKRFVNELAGKVRHGFPSYFTLALTQL